MIAGLLGNALDLVPAIRWTPGSLARCRRRSRRRFPGPVLPGLVLPGLVLPGLVLNAAAGW